MTLLFEKLHRNRFVLRAAQWPRWIWISWTVGLVLFSWLCWHFGLQLAFHPKRLLLPLPVAGAMALLIGAVMLLPERRTSRHFLAGLAVFVLLTGADARRCSYRPEGDEPWYIAIGDSIAMDGDLEISAAKIHDRSPWYYGTWLPPDQLFEINGHMRVGHWPALGAFLVPACLLHDVFLARLEIALLIAFSIAIGSRLFARLWRNEWLGIASMAFLLLETPLATFSLMLFPDEAGTAVFLIALAWLVDESKIRPVLGAVCVGLLVWLKLTFVLVAVACVVLALIVRQREGRGWTGLLWPAVALAATGLAFVVFQLVVFGKRAPDGAVVLPHSVMDLARAMWEPGYRGPIVLKHDSAPVGLAMTLFEPGRGLLVHYPACALLFATALWAILQRRMPATELLGLGSACFLAAGIDFLPALLSGVVTAGGWAPPGRYFPPILVVFLAVAALERDSVLQLWRQWLRSRPMRFVTVAALSVGLVTNMVLVLVPRVAFTDGPHWIQKLPKLIQEGHPWWAMGPCCLLQYIAD